MSGGMIDGVNSPAWGAVLSALRVLRETHGQKTVISLLRQELASETVIQSLAERRRADLMPARNAADLR